MLKTLLACLLANLIAAPTFPDSEVRIGMSKQQVERLVGRPYTDVEIFTGNTPNGSVGYAHYDGLTVYYYDRRAGKVEWR